METGKKRSGLSPRIVAAIAIALIAAIAGYYFIKKDLSKPLGKNQGKGETGGKTSKIKQLLEDKIRDMVIEASDSLYSVQYSDFRINLDSGNALITNFKMVPDEKVLQRLIAQNRAPNNVLRMTAERISMSDFGFVKTDEGRRFGVSDMKVINSSVVITNKLRPNNNRPSDPSLLYKSFKTLFSRMAVLNTTVQNLDFRYINNNRGMSDHLRNLNIVMKGFSSSPAKVGNGRSRTDMKLGYFSMSTPDRYYNIVAKNIILLPGNRTLTMEQCSVLPRYSKARFYKRAGFAKDRYHWEFYNIKWSGINVDQFIKTQQLFVDNYTIGRSWIEIYSNYNYKLKEEQRRNAFPQEKFQTIAFDLTFKKIRILQGDIYYRILADKTDRISTLAITNSTTDINNLTNNTAAKARKPYITVYSRMKVMDAGWMKSWYTFNLKDKAASFTSYSVLGPMDARAFNILSKPLGKIEVKEGRIDKMETYLKVNEYGGNGYVNFYYSGMKMAFLEQDKNTDTLDRKGFLSFVSNTVMPNDNPRKNGEFKKGIVNIKREPWQSFFKVQFDATVDGMSSAMMGVYQKEKGKEKNILKKAAEAIAGPDRGDRKTRKEARKEKREERRKGKS